MGVFAYYDAENDTTVYYVVPDLGSNNDGSTIVSESESTTSRITIQSDELPGYFTTHYGRQQPAGDNLAKFFPSDNVRRYVLRYIVTRSVFGGDYAGPVHEALAPVEGRVPCALELGTRTGTWVQHMATEFPHVQFLSLDVVPMIPHAPRPNIEFQVYNFAEGLLLDDHSQDAVFMNVVMEVVTDYPALLREVHRVLRPGGFLHISDHCPHMWDSEDPSVAAHRTNPASCHLVDLLREQASTVGIDPYTFEKLPGWLAPDSVLWDPETNKCAGFERIESVVQTYPSYPHDGFPCTSLVDARIIPFVRYLTVTSTQDMFGVLRDRGVDQKQANRLIEGMLEELKRPESCAHLKLYRLYAFKRPCEVNVI
ncbi:methyltransferase domain protein [Ceratobasidium sp. AG-Ba]|nr:methyltransferase domain protein [Ceratobasidium sp. AG-Ba]QRW10973.1 methyltransferase domain protein [Ceratobasidium sp. AG-Ba]